MTRAILFEHLEKKVTEFEKQTGKRVEFVYMGVSEFNALKLFHQEVEGGGASYSSVPDILVGLRVLPVKIEQHLAVS